MAYLLYATHAGDARDRSLMQRPVLPRRRRRYSHCGYCAKTDDPVCFTRALPRVLLEPFEPCDLLSAGLMPFSVGLSIGADSINFTGAEQIDDDSSADHRDFSNATGSGKTLRLH